VGPDLAELLGKFAGCYVGNGAADVDEVGAGFAGVGLLVPNRLVLSLGSPNVLAVLDRYPAGF